MNIIDSNLYGSTIEQKNNKKNIKLRDVFIIPKHNLEIIKEIKNTQQDLDKKVTKEPKQVRKIVNVKQVKKEEKKEGKIDNKKEDTISQKNLKIKIKHNKKYEL